MPLLPEGTFVKSGFRTAVLCLPDGTTQAYPSTSNSGAELVISTENQRLCINQVTSVRVYDIQLGSFIDIPTLNAWTMVPVPFGDYVLVGRTDYSGTPDNRPRLINVLDSTETPLDLDPSGLHAMAVSPKRIVYYGGDYGGAHSENLRAYSLDTGGHVATPIVLSAPGYTYVDRLAVSPDGKMLAVVEPWDGSFNGRGGVSVYSTETGALLWRCPYVTAGAFTFSIAFSRDGSLLAVGSLGGWAVADALQIFDTTSWARVRKIGLSLNYSLYSMSFPGPDDELVYDNYSDQTVVDARTGTTLRTYAGLSSGVFFASTIDPPAPPGLFWTNLARAEETP